MQNKNFYGGVMTLIHSKFGFKVPKSTENVYEYFICRMKNKTAKNYKQTIYFGKKKHVKRNLK